MVTATISTLEDACLILKIHVYKAFRPVPGTHRVLNNSCYHDHPRHWGWRLWQDRIISLQNWVPEIFFYYFSNSFSIQFITDYWTEFPVLYSRSLWLSTLDIAVCGCQPQQNGVPKIIQKHLLEREGWRDEGSDWQTDRQPCLLRVQCECNLHYKRRNHLF